MTTAAEVNDAEWHRRENWHGPFYASRRDRRAFVPKRVGIGWTANFAHPVGRGVVLLVSALGVIAMLVALFGPR